MANGYRNALVHQIKDAGQELINRAESMVHPENDLITDFSINADAPIIRNARKRFVKPGNTTNLKINKSCKS